MKKIKFKSKLNLNKQVVSKLNDSEMTIVKGGLFWGQLNAIKPTDLPHCGKVSSKCRTAKLCETNSVGALCIVLP